MVYHLPELDRISRALSRLETALLTHRPNGNEAGGNESGGEDSHVPLAHYQHLQQECQQMEAMLRQTHSLLASLLDINPQILSDKVDKGNVPALPSDADKMLLEHDAPAVIPSTTPAISPPISAAVTPSYSAEFAQRESADDNNSNSEAQDG